MNAVLSAANTWSDNLVVPAGTLGLSIWGTFSATVTVQRTFNGGTTWLDVQLFTEPGEFQGREGEGSIYRAGIKTGEYVSGTVYIRMGV